MFKVGARERATYCLEYCCRTLDAAFLSPAPLPGEEILFLALIAACLLRFQSRMISLSLSLSLSLSIS